MASLWAIAVVSAIMAPLSAVYAYTALEIEEMYLFGIFAVTAVFGQIIALASAALAVA